MAKLNSNPEKNKISLQEAYNEAKFTRGAWSPLGDVRIKSDLRPYLFICDVLIQKTPLPIEGEDVEQKGNQHLIASAPSMLESHLAIYNLISEIPEQDRTIIELTAMKYAETAIRKALKLPEHE